MKKLLLLLVALLLTATLPSVFAGGGQEVVEEVETSFEGVSAIDRSGWDIGKPGGSIVYSELSEPKSFNPIVAQETSTTNITDLVVRPVVRRNQLTLEWEPDLAERWEVSADQKTLTIHLRDGLKWSDGTPLTSDDVIFTVNEVIKNEEVDTSDRDAIKVGEEFTTWTKIDENTFTITYPQVTARNFIIASIDVMPKHIWKPVLDSEGAAALNSFWGVDTDVTKIVGSGPFTISQYVPGEKTVLKKNPLFYQKDAAGNQLPYLDELVYLVVEDQDTQLAKFLAGETTAYKARGEDAAILLERKDELGFEIYSVGPEAGEVFITFNQNPIEGEEDAGIEPPKLTWLSNQQFRVAMAHLIDRPTIIDNVAFGFGYPQYSPVWSKSPYYWAGAKDASYPYDPERAKQLLDEINYIDRDGDGWREDPDGNKISLLLNTNSGNREREGTGEIFTQEARKIGIDITFKPEDFNALVTKLVATYDWEMILIGLTGGPDPGTGQNVYPSSGALHMLEPNQESPRRDWEKAVNAAWDEANITTDEAQRISGFEKFQRIWIEQVPWVYTYNKALIHAVSTTYGNYKPQPVNDYEFKGTLPYIYVK
jgi:peptide/nickel transport system substrate-binding protein